ncbi:hypothetical protein WJM97_22480 [Okeanomitos corallinicola TIOX110]|uniref:VWA containing CoxE family protein n=1 Tax=Okeanomitos corallinicola TIOX110 TaxID=3133117 RepID=A0ABZ2USY1_9CYAN
MSNPPLFDLFCYLRDTGDFPLTIEQYNLLLTALDNGFGLNSREDLKNLCSMLWVKAKPNSEIAKKFSQYFDNYLTTLEIKVNQDLRKTKENKNKTSENQNPEKQNPENPETEVSEPEPIPEFLQPPIALQGGMLPQNKFNPKPKSKFQFNIRDFPVTERKIKRTWNDLRLPVKQGHLTKIDTDATVEKFGKEGFLLDIKFQPQRINRAEVVLLIDVSNSMIPFFQLSQKLVNNLQGSKLGKSEVYYFRNHPGEYLFSHPQSPEGKLTSEVLSQLHQQRTIVLIISDGGAARGGVNYKRIEFTEDFLQELNSCVRQVAWLNPVPEIRWGGTSAQGISELVNMYELDNSGLLTAVRRKSRLG